VRSGAQRTPYDAKRPVLAAVLRGAHTAGLPAADIIGFVTRILLDAKVDVLRAPYGTVAQLAYLESSRNNYVHGIYTNAEVLMYRNVSRVITSISFEVRPLSPRPRGFVHRAHAGPTAPCMTCPNRLASLTGLSVASCCAHSDWTTSSLPTRATWPATKAARPCRSASIKTSRSRVRRAMPCRS